MPERRKGIHGEVHGGAFLAKNCSGSSDRVYVTLLTFGTKRSNKMCACGFNSRWRANARIVRVRDRPASAP
ncbi:hypothetical protein PAMC26577_38435 [Caballeronia sordidicola]|uniref:Uncharacterized protein n=1 Tax=Caballeronia sordidicola TaxID=196367 RepID=A0A242M4N6_CABSO|nr:hypothetical protein PAMC26577_38435 [Caballeronia sordidicola]